MRKATKTVATWLGVVAGVAGLEHGYFEFLQGNTPTPGLAFPSWGPPCVPEEVWHTCEPAMSIIPNFLITGILAMMLSLALIVWANGFVQRKHGGWVQMALSILLLLFGGGFFPPIIALVGGLAGTQINRPLSGKPPAWPTLRPNPISRIRTCVLIFCWHAASRHRLKCLTATP
jgi:hypothetical protein